MYDAFTLPNQTVGEVTCEVRSRIVVAQVASPKTTNFGAAMNPASRTGEGFVSGKCVIKSRIGSPPRKRRKRATCARVTRDAGCRARCVLAPPRLRAGAPRCGGVGVLALGTSLLRPILETLLRAARTVLGPGRSCLLCQFLLCTGGAVSAAGRRSLRSLVPHACPTLIRPSRTALSGAAVGDRILVARLTAVTSGRRRGIRTRYAAQHCSRSARHRGHKPTHHFDESVSFC